MDLYLNEKEIKTNKKNHIKDYYNFFCKVNLKRVKLLNLVIVKINLKVFMFKSRN